MKPVTTGDVAVTFADRVPGGVVSDRADRGRRHLVRRRSGVPNRLRDIVGRPWLLRGLRPPDRRRTRLPWRRLQSRCPNGDRQRSARARLRPTRDRVAAWRPLAYSSESGVSAAEPSFEVVGVVRIRPGPCRGGQRDPYVFHAASAATVSQLVIRVRLRRHPATLAARLPTEQPGQDPVCLPLRRVITDSGLSGRRTPPRPSDRSAHGPARNRHALALSPDRRRVCLRCRAEELGCEAGIRLVSGTEFATGCCRQQ